ncbi:centrosomal protein of 152 kDa-like isoform X2 [Hylaeus volcanicus]|uniref:centrosomal protein of 152 kDa-like isoform X2 n=1 Tax=Hylaeus volcanicus TaxID=313075 RepID=UPI0023B7D965|nr:centrosomal protein of 152 kDa-like isoform X2 [Hylaeus volcanicus]
MEGPGLSLFQGSESIRLNASTQGLEEDEEQEDIKRRNMEIKDLLTNAFDDLEEEDDISSVNSSHYRDSTKEAEDSNVEINSCAQGVVSPNSQTVSQLQKEFGIYDHVENSNNYDNAMTNHRSELEIGPSISDVQRDFSAYDQTDTPYSKSNRSNDLHNAATETPYELARPLNSGFPKNLRPQIDEEYTFNENYPYNYQTPANHYVAQNKTYSNNGYIDGYENSVQSKQIHDFGGGDNVTSDHINHCYKASPNGRPLDDCVAYKTAEYDSKEQLEVLYTVRMREIKRLTEEMQQLQLEREEEKSQLSRKIILLQAEIERSSMSRNQTQHALVDAKAEIADLHNQITSLKEKNAVLEKTNQNTTEELNIAKDSVAELQQKIAVLERVQALQTNDKTHEKFLKQAQEKHAVEIKNMQTQINVLTDKLNTKETSYVALENKLADVRRAHEMLMVEKGDTMNRLAQALEESQAQCHNLMATNNAQHLMQLQTQIKILTQEKEEMQKVIQELQNKLEVAKSDVAQYDSLLTTTLEEESDSMRQMKLGELHNRSKSKPSDDMANKLRGELQRCLAGHAVKRKEITRLENTLSQKEKEVDKALTVADMCRQEAARYAKRVNELEQELKSVLTDQAVKANAQIQKLSNHLSDVKKQYESLREEKVGLEQKLEETLAINQETLKKLHQESVNQQEKDAIDEYNKEYLEIHAKAVERVRQEAQIEVVQLSVQLEQTQKELDRVKELYIDVCSTKEQLISEHKSEIKMLKEKYANLEERENDIEKYKHDLRAQVKIAEKLTKECDMYRAKIIELEKNLSHERKKKEEYTKKIHQEIERAKEEALKELRNAYPNQEISVLLPDHCSEHLEKINQLEEDCKRLEEKLHAAVDVHKRMSEYQSELDDSRLKIAQIEISQESWKKKYENAVSERNDLLSKISQLESTLSSSKRNSKMDDSDDVKLKVTRYQVENEALKKECEDLSSERNIYKDKISQLEAELSEAKKIIGNFESRFRKSSEVSLTSKCELEKELSHYKDLVTQLSSKISILKAGRKGDLVMEQRTRQLEQDLQGKNEKLERLKDLEKIKEERDQLVQKLKYQAKQFEQYVKNQKQVSAELNLSPRSCGDGTDFQKIKEIMIKEVREEMEQKVVEELRGIEEHHREKRKELEEKYKTVLLELQTKCNEKAQEVETLKEAMISEKVKIHSSFKAKEQFVCQMIESKFETYYKELVARKLKIEKLQEELNQKENDVEEERNLMAQVMTKWAAEIREIKDKEVEMNDKLRELKESESHLKAEIDTLKDKEKEMKTNIDTLKHKYQSAKKTANNYKEHAENKEKFLLSECKRIEEGYKRAMNQVQQKLEAIVSTQEEQVATKLKELECQYTERMEQMRLTLKYKNKC